MQATPSFESTPGISQTAAKPQRLVTDAPIRMFHWLFALSFLGAYLTGDAERFRLLHVTLGYTMAGLLAFRVLYGLFGPRQAGLGLMWRRVAGVPAWLRSMAQSRSLAVIASRQTQNLLMALAVVVLLLLVAPLTLSGYGTYHEWDKFLGGDWLEDVHEFFGQAFLAVVLIHLGLILVLSIVRRRNQALPMLSGRVDGPGPNLVSGNRVWLASLLLVAVLSYGAWEWNQSPNGLVSAGAVRGHESRDHHHDD